MAFKKINSISLQISRNIYQDINSAQKIRTILKNLLLKYHMSTIKYPKIISVTGAHSRVGKTTLCSILLNEFKGFGAIKFTKTPEHRQTEVKKIRSSEDKNFSTSQLPNFPSSKVTNSELIEDLNILNQKGKDTAIFLESGAERVIWIQSPYYELENILKTALGKIDR